MYLTCFIQELSFRPECRNLLKCATDSLFRRFRNKLDRTIYVSWRKIPVIGQDMYPARTIHRDIRPGLPFNTSSHHIACPLDSHHALQGDTYPYYISSPSIHILGDQSTQAVIPAEVPESPQLAQPTLYYGDSGIKPE